MNAIGFLSIGEHLASTCVDHCMQCSSTVALVTRTLFTSRLFTSSWQTNFTNLAAYLRSRPWGSPSGYASRANESLVTRKGWSSTVCLWPTGLSVISNALGIDGARRNLLLLQHCFIILKAEVVPRKWQGTNCIRLFSPATSTGWLREAAFKNIQLWWGQTCLRRHR